MARRKIYADELMRKFDFYQMAHEFYRYIYRFPELTEDDEWKTIMKVAEDILIAVRCQQECLDKIKPEWYREFLRFYTKLETAHYDETREFIFAQKHKELLLQIGRNLSEFILKSIYNSCFVSVKQ